MSSLDQLPAVSQLAEQEGAWVILGGGSNLVLPEVLSRPVLKVELKGIRLLEDRPDAWLIEAAGGENWHDFVQYCIQKGWPGLENLALIPGTVGAAPVQNIGAYGLELAARIDSVCAWNIPESRLVMLSAQDCRFAYRDSVFKQAPRGTWLITSVRFRLPKPWQAITHYPDLARHEALLDAVGRACLTATDIFQAVCEIRRAKLPDPKVLGNAGSFFKNPVVSAEKFLALKRIFPNIVGYPQDSGQVKLAAAWLIDQAGWKGKRVGTVGVHDKQALVLVNLGQAKAKALLELAEAIVASVAEKYQVSLEIEPMVIA